MTIEIINWFQEVFGPNSRLMFDFFSNMGTVGIVIVMACCFWLGGSRFGLRVGFCLVFGFITNTLLKWTLVQPRPYYSTDAIQALKASDGLGMPSGHSQSIAAQWGGVAWFTKRKILWIIGAIIVIGTGSARIYYGVHSPVQVLAGWLVGIFIVVCIAKLERPVVSRFQRMKWPGQLTAVVAIVSGVIGVGYLVSMGLRGGFEPPADWYERFLATAERVGEDDLEFKLIVPADIISQAGWLLGMALCGLFVLHRGHTDVAGKRVLNLVVGLPLLVLSWFGMLVLGEIVGEHISGTLTGILVPLLVAIAVPAITSKFKSKSKT